MITEHDLAVLAWTLHGEGAGLERAPRVALGHLILNRYRVRHGGAGSVAAVCLAPGEFPWWDTHTSRASVVHPIDPLVLEGYAAALEALTTDDTTRGALYYRRNPARPRWSRGLQPVCTVEPFEFFTSEGSKTRRRGVRAGELLAT